MKIPTYRISQIIIILLCLLLCFEQSGFAQVAAQLDIAGHLGAMRNSLTTDKFRPIHLRYLQYLPEQNSFRLLLDKGDELHRLFSPTDLKRLSPPTVF